MREFLRRTPGGGPLAPRQAAELLGLLRNASASGPGRRPRVRQGTEVGGSGWSDDPRVRLSQCPGLGGTLTEALSDQSARLTPLTDTDADKLVRSVRLAPLLLGQPLLAPPI